MTAKLRKFCETGSQGNDEPLVCIFEDFLNDIKVEHVLTVAEPKLNQALARAWLPACSI